MEFPTGILIDDMDHISAVQKTQTLLDNNKNVVIFEGAFLHNGCFIRCDIIVKRGNVIQLYEVKSTSFNPYNFTMRQKRNPNKILAKWLPLLYDVGYQSVILERALPSYRIISNMTMLDITSKTSINGLNQIFKVSYLPSGMVVTVNKIRSRGNRIIDSIKIDEFINMIKDDIITNIEAFLDVIQDKKVNYAPLGIKCKTCAFGDDGRTNCFNNKLSDYEFNPEIPTIFDIWNYRGIDKSLADNIMLMKDIGKDQFLKDGQFKNITSKRQWLQIERTLKNDLSENNEFIDEDLYTVLSEWKYPLHFIDFETTRVAIPFYSDSHPYELVVFQYSIHTIYEDGQVTHNEWLETGAGVYPNIDFIRNLKRDLGADNGTVFCYSQYENTVLNTIAGRLSDFNLSDEQELIEFIQSLTTQKIKNKIVHTGDRVMIDMLRLIKQFYYHPLMKGSNSIKDVLPSVLHVSEYLKEKYQQKYIGGTNYGDNMIWFKQNEHGVINPYTFLSRDNSISSGQEAMLCYMQLQFTDVNQSTRDMRNKQLLKYCELDSLSMLMIFEHWKYRSVNVVI